MVKLSESTWLKRVRASRDRLSELSVTKMISAPVKATATLTATNLKWTFDLTIRPRGVYRTNRGLAMRTRFQCDGGAVGRVTPCAPSYPAVGRRRTEIRVSLHSFILDSAFCVSPVGRVT